MARVRLDRGQITLTAQRFAVPLVQKTASEVLSGARHLAPEGDHLSGSGKTHKGPTLQRSLYSRMTRANSATIRARVGAKAQHALSEHEGSSPHFIRGRRGKMLKFRWDRGDFLVAARAGRRRGNRRTGQFHYFVRVRHPGNKRPVRYLTTPLSMFGKANGFRVTLTGGSGHSRLP